MLKNYESQSHIQQKYTLKVDEASLNQNSRDEMQDSSAKLSKVTKIYMPQESLKMQVQNLVLKQPDGMLLDVKT